MSKERTEMIFEDINSLSLNFGEHVCNSLPRNMSTISNPFSMSN